MTTLPPKRRSTKKRVWPYVLLGTILVFVLAAVAGAFFAQSSLLDRAQKEHKEELLTAKDKATIMIMGVDERSDDVGRSDTLMVATIDPVKNEASLLSIPRDTRVAIPRNGYDKINAAYAYGGEKLTQRTVEDFLGIQIDHYVIINVHAFQKIVDAIGGIDIDVEKRMYYEDPWDDNGGLVIDLQAGEQHMNGAQAIQYVRYRDGEGDIGRIGRQQRFMRALFAQFLSPQVLPRLAAVVDEVKNAVDTDLTTRQLLTLAMRLRDMESGGISMQMVAGTPAYLGDVSYWIPDLVETRRELFAGVGKELSARMQEAAEHDAAAYRKNTPERLRIMAEEDDRELLPSSEELLAEGDRVIGEKRAERNAAEKKAAVQREEAKEKQESAPAKERSKDTADDISVMIINASGIDGAGAEIADTLRAKGFRISSVETGNASDRPKTAIMTAETHVNLFYGMPFPCVIMPVDGAGEQQAIVIIGRDYRPEAVHKDGEE